MRARARGSIGGLAGLVLTIGLAPVPAAAQDTLVDVDAVCSTTVGGTVVVRFDVVPGALEAFEFPIGSDNAFSPGPADRGQPTVFGPAPMSVGIPFDPDVDPPMTWVLGGSQATASGDLPACADDDGPPPVPLLDSEVPDDLRRSILEEYVAQGRISEPFARGPRGPAGPVGSVGPSGPAGPSGSAGAPGVVVVRERLDPSSFLVLDASTAGALTADCPEGSIAVAGGADPDDASAELTSSTATPDGGGWMVDVTESAEGAVEVYAVCLASTSANVMPPPDQQAPGGPDDGAGNGGGAAGPATGTGDPSNAGGGDTSREGSTDAAISEPSRGDLARTGRNLVMLTILAAGCLAAGTALRRRFSTAR